MYDVYDWAEIHRLHREGHSNSAIARRLGMSRTTVIRLLGLGEPPAYRRAPKGSILDPFKDRIAGMLLDDPAVPATVILRELRRAGYGGGITTLKEHPARVRPGFRRALAHQRTSYLPGEVAQGDRWHTGLRIPVGKGAVREAFGG